MGEIIRNRDFLKKRGLIIWGGWNGHNPEYIAIRLKELLSEDYNMEMTSHFGVLLDYDLTVFDIIIPIWSCGINSRPYMDAMISAVKQGTGLATFHGGINWFDHEDYFDLIGGEYIQDERVKNISIRGTEMLNRINMNLQPFKIDDELYQIKVDPNCPVLVKADYENREYPIAWTNKCDKGKVFYTALAHNHRNLFNTSAIDLILSGIKWATR